MEATAAQNPLPMSEEAVLSSPGIGNRSKSSSQREQTSSKGNTTTGGLQTTGDKYETVLVKDNVTIHPTQAASERIAGCLRLIKQGQSLFMTWIPYNQAGDAEVAIFPPLADMKSKGIAGSKSSERDRNLYTIRAVSVSEMRSIRRHTPALGWHYIIIVLTSGLAFPPLYFHNGGVREFLTTLKQYALLVRSADDANVYLVNDIEDPLQRSLASLDIPDAVTGSSLPVHSHPQPSSSRPEMKEEVSSSTELSSQLGNSQHPSASSNSNELAGFLPEINAKLKSFGLQHRVSREPVDAARDMSIQILEKFSMVTRAVRDTGVQLFRSANGDGPLLGGSEAENHMPQPRMHNMDPRQSNPGVVRSVGSLPSRQLTSSSNSRPMAASESSAHYNSEAADTNVGSFELVEAAKMETQGLVYKQARPPPLGPDEWASFLDSEGRVMDGSALRKRVFQGGLEPTTRKEIWKFLLGYFSFNSTRAERKALMEQKEKEYSTLKFQWQSISREQAKRFAKFRERRNRVDKDVVRTDRTLPFYEGEQNENVEILRTILITYSFYNFDLGYCQGMSDLLSPILYVMGDEAEAFWCFVAFMERMAPNFHRDQTGMHSQLLALSKLVILLDTPLHEYLGTVDSLNYFFCFRWILIHFKREFKYEEVLRLWEVLWSRHISEHFHLYICVAILKRHRRSIMDEQMEFDMLLKFMNDLSGHIDLDTTLRDAETLCRLAGERGAACMPPASPELEEEELDN